MVKKDKKKRRSRRYGQVQKKHAKKGIYSCLVGTGVLLLLMLLLVIAYVTKGQNTAVIGVFGIGALALSIHGLVTGIKGLREREKNYNTCKVGIGVNGFFVLLFIMIFIRGLM